MTATPTRTLPAAGHGIAEAARILAQGGLVAVPTETVYGLAADARNGTAVARVYAAKGRPSFNPLIVHVPDLPEAERLAKLPPRARGLAERAWPGPLTLVLPLRPEARIAALVTAGLPTVAIRVPAHPVARTLLRACGFPLAAPSANPSGRVSPTTAAHVLAGLSGRIDAVLDGGPSGIGVESTILGFESDMPVLLRPGGMAVEEIENLLGVRLAAPAAAAPDRPSAPGQLASHYAPTGRLRLNATAPEPGETMLGFGPVGGDLTLSATGDLVEAAARLFECLHRLDRQGALRIAVAPIPQQGLGLAINDRLARAAAPRDGDV